MPFEIIWSRSAEKELKKLDRLISKRIYDAVGKLREDPYRNIKKLTNSDLFRLRVGNYRVIMDINEDQLRILVIKVGHRKLIYK